MIRGLVLGAILATGAACGDDENDNGSNGSNGELMPSVTVQDQTADPADQVVVQEVVSDGPGWMVIHEDDGGAPGAVIGFSAVGDGSNADVQVTLDRDAVDQETLYAMLHVDAGVVGTYEFPGPDGPVMDGMGNVIAPPFTVTVTDGTGPDVAVSDQSLELSTVVSVDQVVSAGPGWIVIHEDDGMGGIGGVIGFSAVSDGSNANVSVPLDRPLSDQETVFAMLHVDEGMVGTYEFPGPDGPVTRDGSPIAPPLVVTVPAGTAAVRLSFSGGVPDYMVGIEPSTFEGDISGSADPTITLRAGFRYEVMNMVSVGHPFEIIDMAGNELLSEADDGSLEDDVETDWTDDGSGTVRFTVDADLQAEAAQYRCSIHTGSMIGDLAFMN